MVLSPTSRSIILYVDCLQPQLPTDSRCRGNTGHQQVFCSRFGCGKGGAAWETALLQLTKHVYASHAELADAMLCMLWDMFDSWGLAGDSQAFADQDDSMTGAAELAVVKESWRAMPESRCAVELVLSHVHAVLSHVQAVLGAPILCRAVSTCACCVVAVFSAQKTREQAHLFSSIAPLPYAHPTQFHSFISLCSVTLYHHLVHPPHQHSPAARRMHQALTLLYVSTVKHTAGSSLCLVRTPPASFLFPCLWSWYGLTDSTDTACMHVTSVALSSPVLYLANHSYSVSLTSETNTRSKAQRCFLLQAAAATLQLSRVCWTKLPKCAARTCSGLTRSE